MELVKGRTIQIQIQSFFNPILQVSRSIPRKQLDILLFLIIPVIYLINTFILHKFQGSFFLGSVDPEYFYLYNGVVLSDGNLSLQYIAHPGIPLQYLIAFSTWIVSFFQPGEKLKDFIDDPEKYIHAANLFMNVLITLVLFFCGMKAKKYSGSFFTALLLQLSPFASGALLCMSRRLIPESIMIIPMLLTALMVIRHIYKENENGNSISEVVFFALIIGFGTACKLSFLPVLVIPLILLKINYKKKIQLFLYTLLFFAVFAYPVIFNFKEFWPWVTGIFTHTGKYGTGGKGLIDFATLPGNLKMLFDSDRVFFYISLISLLLSVIFSFKQFKNKGFSNSKINRAIVAINVSLFVCIILILKHFSLYYFTPLYLFNYLLILLSVILIIQYDKISRSKRLRTISLSIATIFVLFLTFQQAEIVRSSITGFSKRNDFLQKQYEQVTLLVDKDKPLIMAADYFGSPFIEYAHFSGYIMTGHLRHCFTGCLKEKFPNAYEFVNWNDKFYYWGDLVDINSILAKTTSSFYLYIGSEQGHDFQTIEDRIWKVLDKNKAMTKVLFQDENSDERLVEISLIKN